MQTLDDRNVRTSHPATPATPAPPETPRPPQANPRAPDRITEWINPGIPVLRLDAAARRVIEREALARELGVRPGAVRLRQALRRRAA
jgi:hypothetical protein